MYALQLHVKCAALYLESGGCGQWEELAVGRAASASVYNHMEIYGFPIAGQNQQYSQKTCHKLNWVRDCPLNYITVNSALQRGSWGPQEVLFTLGRCSIKQAPLCCLWSRPRICIPTEPWASPPGWQRAIFKTPAQRGHSDTGVMVACLQGQLRSYRSKS